MLEASCIDELGIGCVSEMMVCLNMNFKIQCQKKEEKKRDKIRSRARYLGVGRVLACILLLLGSCALACILAFTGRVGRWPCVGCMVKGPYVGLLDGRVLACS